MNKVYVVVIDSVEDFEHYLEMKTFSNVEAAKKHLAIVKEEFMQECGSSYDPEFYTIEEDEMSFSWYESGEYNNNHYDVVIYEEEVYDE